LDILYEESASPHGAKRGEKWYKVVNIIFYVTMIIGIITLFMALTSMPLCSLGADATEEQKNAYGMSLSLGITFGFIGLFFISVCIAMYLIKRRINVSYDYIFVSGDLRISKVFNVNKRKFILKLEPDDFLQIGDIDNPSYDRFKGDPSIKEVVLTPNTEAAEGKFFMYILAATTVGKRLYVLECREELLINILKFVKRGTLESDYVMQEKKTAR